MQTAIIAQVIDQTAARYARRVWWVELDDLRQEAWLEVLSMDLRFLDRAAPSRAKGYVHRIVARRMSRFLWRESSPVPCSGHRDKQQSAGRLRAPIASVAHLHDRTQPGPEAEVLAREARRLEPELRAQVRARLQELACKGSVSIDVLLLVVLDGRSALSVSRETGLDRRLLGREAQRVRAELSQDRAARRLLAELVERRCDAEA